MPDLAIKLDDRTYGNLHGLAIRFGMPPEELVAQGVILVVNDLLLVLELIRSDPAALTKTSTFMPLIELIETLADNPEVMRMGAKAEEDFQRRLQSREGKEEVQ